MTPTADQIADWLMTYLAKALAMPESELNPNARFADLGLSSRKAVQLSSDLETWLGVTVAPDLAWDYPSVTELSRHLGA